MTRRAVFVFPGQGSQFPGMGRELCETFPVARQVLEEVDDALAAPLSRLILGGPEDLLSLTENTQPALMAVSLAVVRVIETEGGFPLHSRAAFMAGHSLGEYSALAAAGSLGIGDTAVLLRRRGRAMQAAVPPGTGAMAAILGLSLDDIVTIVADAGNNSGNGDTVACANDNAPGQVVISGHDTAVRRVVALAGDRGARRSVFLPVSAPFHSPLMTPAAQEMQEILEEVPLTPPPVPLVSNVTARPVTGPSDIRALLVRQVTDMVRWRESIAWIASQGELLHCEPGAGRVLGGLARRICPAIRTLPALTPQEIGNVLEQLQQQGGDSPATPGTTPGNGVPR